MVLTQGLEPRSTEPKSVVLPIRRHEYMAEGKGFEPLGLSPTSLASLHIKPL